MKNRITCKTCDKVFFDYISNKDRKYCSLNCRPSPRKGRNNKIILKCDYCDKEFKKYNSQIKNYKGVFCSVSCKQKGIWKYTPTWNKGLKGFRAGEKSHLWKGGITAETKKIRTSFEYRKWRTSIFERDNYTCIFCGIKGSRLNADHIKPFSLYPDLRFELSNGRTLCESCHQKTNTYGTRLKTNYV